MATGKRTATIPEWRPGQPSRWIVVGSAGRRVVDQPLVIGAVARMMMIDQGQRHAEVHAGSCGLGKVAGGLVGMQTDAGRCTCTPTAIDGQVAL
jgi:hypothetical protein